MIVALDPGNKEHRLAAAELHGSLLPESPIAGLGRRFMKNFYYDKLVRDGLIICDLYFHEGRYVALSSYTRDPFTFMARGKKKHFLFLFLTVAAGLLIKPSRLGTLLKTMRLGKQRECSCSCKAENGQVAELLSFAVKPEYSSHRDAATGKKVPNLLCDRVIDFFRKEGYAKIQFIVKKDNKPSLLFFNSYKAQVREADFVDLKTFMLEVFL